MKPIAHFAPLLLLAALGLPSRAAAQPALQRERIQVQATEGADKIRTQAVEVPVRVFTPSPSPPPAPLHCPPVEAASRRVLPDDSVETTYADGTVKTVYPDGRSLTLYPDGTSVEETRGKTVWRDKEGNVVSSQPKQYVFVQVPRATPPDPPASGSTLAIWLARHNESLLSALRALLANEAGGPESLNGYLAREQGMGLYDQIASRTQLLGRILDP